MAITRKIRGRIYKKVYANRTSEPFISGDQFRINSDFTFTGSDNVRNSTMRNLVEAKVIFCKGDKAKEFMAEYSNVSSASVIIVGNSDEEFDEPFLKIPRSVKLVLMQNMNFSAPNYLPIPIGLENLALANNGFPLLMHRDVSWEESVPRVLVGPFSLTHSERSELLRLTSEPHLDFLSSRLPPHQYAKIAGGYRFVACPRGNGIDTHRLWETIYRGSIPILTQSNWLKNFDWLSNHCIPLQKWDDLTKFSVDDLAKVKKPDGIPEQLWWPYWKKLIANYC